MVVDVFCQHVVFMQPHFGGCTTELRTLSFFNPFQPTFTHFHPFLSFEGGNWIMTTGNHLTASTFTTQQPFMAVLFMQNTHDEWIEYNAQAGIGIRH